MGLQQVRSTVEDAGGRDSSNGGDRGEGGKLPSEYWTDGRRDDSASEYGYVKAGWTVDAGERREYLRHVGQSARRESMGPQHGEKRQGLLTRVYVAGGCRSAFLGA